MAEEREVLVRIKAVLDEFRQGFKQGMAEAQSEASKTAAAISRDFSGMQKTMEGFGKGMTKLGAGMSLALSAPLTMIAKQSVQDFGEAARAVADVEAALKSTGGTAGVTADQLKKFADDAQFNSLYQDEEILKEVSANLLRFGNVTGDVFMQTQQMALDLSARLGKDLSSSTTMLGKALNDPVRGIGLLRKAGVDFGDDQEKLIKKLAESGDMLGAQKIMLAELTTKYSGAAQAAADAGGMGSVNDFNKAMGELREVWGSVLVEIMTPFVEVLKEVVNWFRNLSPETQKFVVYAGLLAAALGPVMTVLGPLIVAFSALAPVIAALGAPVAVFVAALAGISIVMNELGISFAQQWEAIKVAFGGVITFFQLQIQLLKQILTGDFAGAFETVKQIFLNFQQTIMGIIEALFPGLIATITTFFTNFITTVSTKIAEVIQWFTTLKDQVVNIVSTMVQAITDKLVGGLQYAWDAVASGLQKVKDAFNDAYMYIVGGSVVPDMVNEIGAHMDTLNGQNLVDPAKKATDEVSNLFSGLADTVKSYISDFIKTGKFDIEGFMADISGKLIDWGLDMLFKNLLGGLGGGGGLLGGLFAKGGDPPLNKPSIVGENGPELFIPKSRGTVIPSKQSREMLNGSGAQPSRTGNAGGGNTWNVTVMAKDVDSFRRTESSIGRTMRRQAELGMRAA